MSGFIGIRAKKRRRNKIVFFILIFIFLLFYFKFPVFKLNEIMPSNTLLPSSDETISSEIQTIEELELEVFERDQKIIFRTNEIKKLKEQFNILVKENKQLLDTVTDLSNQQNSTAPISKDVESINTELEIIKKEYTKELLKLNNIILKITDEKNDLFLSIEKVSLENELSKKEQKIILKKNMQLINLKRSQIQKIIEQDLIIDDLNLLVEKLKDNYHHR